jgi:serralysin
MAADILAIQKLYGKAHNGDTAGATTWGSKISLNNTSMTIWDEGGNDTLNLTGNRFDNRVDLDDGSYSDVGAYNGRHQIGNLGIAQGTVIENVAMGGGNDDVSGNQAANLILLGRGDDRADGREGNDTLDGQEGNDTLRGGDGNDTLTGGVGSDSFVFTKGADRVTDFENNRDTIVLSREFWGGRTPSDEEALSRAHVDGDDIVFDFGGGNTLRIENVTDINALADDLTFA